MKSLKVIKKDSFSRYGEILAFPPDSMDNFYIVTTEEREPWRLAVFRYKNKEIKQIECHPESMESFEPLCGITVLIVAENGSPEEYEAFILDQPVCLKKGIWHQVLALTEEAQVKITENLNVSSEFYELKKPISVFLG